MRRNKMKLNLTAEKISEMNGMNFNDAVQFALSIIDSAHKNSVDVTDKMKIVRLKYNISTKKNTVQLMKMFYDIMLSGEGHAVKGSKWKKHYAK
jgi:uncharacterized protein YxjI